MCCINAGTRKKCDREKQQKGWRGECKKKKEKPVTFPRRNLVSKAKNCEGAGFFLHEGNGSYFKRNY